MESVIEKILSLLQAKKTVFVAIDGMPGSGKTTLSKLIEKKISMVKIIRVDFFYNMSIGNTDFDRLKREVLVPLKNGKPTNFRIYNWKLNSSEETSRVDPGGVIVVEGISAMDRRLVNLYDYKIWVDCPTQIGLERVLRRDNKKYEKLWTEKWMPGILDFIDKQKPYKKADVLFSYKDIHE